MASAAATAEAWLRSREGPPASWRKALVVPSGPTSQSPSVLAAYCSAAGAHGHGRRSWYPGPGADIFAQRL